MLPTQTENFTDGGRTFRPLSTLQRHPFGGRFAHNDHTYFQRGADESPGDTESTGMTARPKAASDLPLVRERRAIAPDGHMRAARRRLWETATAAAREYPRGAPRGKSSETEADAARMPAILFRHQKPPPVTEAGGRLELVGRYADPRNTPDVWRIYEAIPIRRKS